MSRPDVAGSAVTVSCVARLLMDLHADREGADSFAGLKTYAHEILILLSPSLPILDSVRIRVRASVLRSG